MDHRLDTGNSPSRPIIHIKTQLLSKGPKCVLSCTISALDCHLSNGMAEDQLLCQVRALRFYLERSMPWREHKCFLFVLFKPGPKRGIVPSTISGWIQKTILECYTKSPTPFLKSHKVKAHQVQSMAASLAFHRQASMEQIVRAGTWRCHDNFTDLSQGPISLFCQSHSTRTSLWLQNQFCTKQKITTGSIVYIPPSIHLDSAPCEVTEPG